MKLMKFKVFWHITVCQLVNNCGHFEEHRTCILRDMQSESMMLRVWVPNYLTLSCRTTYIYIYIYIYICRTAPLTSRCCILYIIQQIYVQEYFKHAAYSVFFSSKCRLFHNATFFGSCVIHILYTGCAKIKKKIPAPKG